jgi:hypothetical protein
MVWMIAIAPAAMLPPASAMPAMAMPASGAAMSTGPLPARDTIAVNALLGTYFMLAALWWIARGLRQSWTAISISPPARTLPGRLASGPAIASHALMSAGTGVMLLAMR